jgi:hypothetical protein
MCRCEKQLSVLRILMFNFNKQQRSKIARAYFGYNNFMSPSLPYTSKISKLKPHLSQLNLKRAFKIFSISAYRRLDRIFYVLSR